MKQLTEEKRNIEMMDAYWEWYNEWKMDHEHGEPTLGEVWRACFKWSKAAQMHDTILSVWWNLPDAPSERTVELIQSILVSNE